MKGKKLLVAAGIAASFALSSASAFADVAKVAVSQIVEHPALDAARQGLLDGLKAKGYVEGENLEFTYQTAQGNPAIAVQIAKQFVGEQPDVLVGIATPTAQALAASTRSIPVVFTAVTDPVGAKLVKNMEKPNGNVTGLSDLSPVAQHVELMQEIIPNLKSIGVVFNPGESNAVALVELLREAAKAKGIEVVEGTALKSADVQSAAQIIASKVDVIYAPTDNTVASAIDGLVNAANQANKPIIGASTTYIENGALAALGFDYYQVGIQTADYVDALLKGTKIADLPVNVAKGSDLALNQKAAEKLGISFPAAVLARATSIEK
ncbi:ABC transporter substrate-binding protein [Photobacterium profundum]|uniref:Putative ABC transporter substrate-binding protein n=1 Tax=Photobacterium profundum 3TCK TaxID=314280 RepID=Q1Z264_9GAMM|nr:ABC transporter substrate-binding protein [Photobacterium profundum]EAS42621.1 putative ABC transporter substrate-binding protein [Photobacterium profundum 3TCK]PSV59264.1 ABC transporter substrate-binding protein [Photobacterium profundum]